MDDRKRKRYEEKMNCPDCEKNFVLDMYEVNRKGVWKTTSKWIMREDDKKAKKLELEAHEMFKKAEKMAMKRYLDAWMEYLSGVKNKREIWNLLTSNGKHYPSLSTFYKHLKAESLTEYLKLYFYADSTEEFKKTMKILKKEDLEIINIFKKADEKIAQADKKRGRPRSAPLRVWREGDGS